jgi:UDP-N-acetylmuramate dehydrogenase
MNDLHKEIHSLDTCGTLLRDEPMSSYTSFRTGGPADYIITPDSCSDIPAIVKFCRENSVPLTVIGWGSNLLVSDRGIRGLVLRAAAGTDRRPVIEIREGGSVYAEASVLKSDFISFCADAGLAGVEFMAGIPGCVGGGVFMNAGTNMGDFAGILKKIFCADSEGNLFEISADAGLAGYRSIALPSGAVITGAEFTLEKGNDPRLVHERVKAIIGDRNKKHPVTFPSAGSVFKNPPGHSSWKLIQDAGLRGRRVGGAMISELHTNFIINAGGATSADILNLVREVQEKVYSVFGVALETEIRLTGEF